MATRGLMPGIRIHEIYAVGSIALRGSVRSSRHTYYTLYSTRKHFCIKQDCCAALRRRGAQRRGVLVNAAGCCFLNAVAMVGVVPYRKYAAGSPAPSPELSAFFLVSSLLALLPYSVQAVSFPGFCVQPAFQALSC